MTERRQTVPAGTPDLLVVALDVLGQVKMQHIAHIGLVYAHAESHCGHHDQHIIPDKSTLVGFALLTGQAGVIGCNRVTTIRQRLRQFIHLATRVAVDNTRLVRVPGDQLHGLIDGVLLLYDLQKQIRPVKAGNKSIGPGHLQNACYILLNPGGRRCRERHTDSIGQTLAHIGKLAIFRAKIMAPLRDAVRFINSQTVCAHR